MISTSDGSWLTPRQYLPGLGKFLEAKGPSWVSECGWLVIYTLMAPALQAWGIPEWGQELASVINASSADVSWPCISFQGPALIPKLGPCPKQERKTPSLSRHKVPPCSWATVGEEVALKFSEGRADNFYYCLRIVYCYPIHSLIIHHPQWEQGCSSTGLTCTRSLETSRQSMCSGAEDGWVESSRRLLDKLSHPELACQLSMLRFYGLSSAFHIHPFHWPSVEPWEKHPIWQKEALRLRKRKWLVQARGNPDGGSMLLDYRAVQAQVRWSWVVITCGLGFTPECLGIQPLVPFGYLWLWDVLLAFYASRSLWLQDTQNSGVDTTLQVERKKGGWYHFGGSAQWEDNARAPSLRVPLCHKDRCTFLNRPDRSSRTRELGFGGWEWVLLLLALFRDALVQWTSCPMDLQGLRTLVPWSWKAKPCLQPCPWISDISFRLFWPLTYQASPKSPAWKQSRYWN